MKVLLIGMGNKVFIPDLYKNLLLHGVDADMLDLQLGLYTPARNTAITFGSEISSKNFLVKNYRLYRQFQRAKRLCKQNNQQYDVCNIHFLDVRYFFMQRWLFRLANKLVISTYGTDFNTYRKFSFLQKPFYKKANRITFANPDLITRFDLFYNKIYSKKLKLCRFGLERIKELSQDGLEQIGFANYKSKQRIPDNKIIITIGYSSNPIHQQDKIILELQKIPPSILSKVFLIFPMSYGGFNNHIAKVDQLAKTSRIPFLIIKDFLSDEDVKYLRQTSDIMINLLTQDQLSATMCEYLYTKNYVITGSWLPYEPIDELGIVYSRINDLSELAPLLSDVIVNLDHYKEKIAKNPQLIQNFSSWDNNIKDWMAVYNA